MEYLEDVLSDPDVPAARRDRVAIAMLGVLLRQGGLSRKAIAEREAKEIGNNPNSHCWDAEAGCSLLDPNHSEKLAAARRERGESKEAPRAKRSWDETLGPGERAVNEWIDPATGKSDLEFRPYPPPVDDE